VRDYSYELQEGNRFHYKARVYNPRLGRFLQTDPIFYKDNMNMYAYVGNDPVNKIDSTGMFQAYANSLRSHVDYSRTSMGMTAIMNKGIDDLKTMGKFSSGVGDIISIAGTATGQGWAVGLGMVMSTGVDLMVNSTIQNAQDALNAQAAGEVGGKVAANLVNAAADASGITNIDGRVDGKVLSKVSDALGMAGSKGKVADGILNTVATGAEIASQQVSGAVTEKVLEKTCSSGGSAPNCN
jgi:RHS repeat-associated protein